MTKLNTTNIKGKAYVEVKDRIKYFRANFPKYSMLTEIVAHTDKEIVMRAIIKNESGTVVADGIAHEIKGSSMINNTSFVENCQTSAWGRALGNLGIGIDDSVASADEVDIAIKRQSDLEKTPDFKKKAKLKELKAIVVSNGIENDKVRQFIELLGFKSSKDMDLENLDVLINKLKGENND